jgi:hypothetical protein
VNSLPSILSAGRFSASLPPRDFIGEAVSGKRNQLSQIVRQLRSLVNNNFDSQSVIGRS